MSELKQTELQNLIESLRRYRGAIVKRYQDEFASMVTWDYDSQRTMFKRLQDGLWGETRHIDAQIAYFTKILTPTMVVVEDQNSRAEAK